METMLRESSTERGSARIPLLVLGALVLTGTLVWACGGGRTSTSPQPPAPPPPPPPPTANTFTVAVRDNTFEPRSITVRPGDTVRWVMQGSAPGHSVTDNGGLFDSGFVFIQNGSAYERVFTAAEENRTFEYRCVSHQGCCQMQGSVRVGDGAPSPGPGY